MFLTVPTGANTPPPPRLWIGDKLRASQRSREGERPRQQHEERDQQQPDWKNCNWHESDLETREKRHKNTNNQQITAVLLHGVNPVPCNNVHTWWTFHIPVIKQPETLTSFLSKLVSLVCFLNDSVVSHFNVWFTLVNFQWIIPFVHVKLFQWPCRFLWSLTNTFGHVCNFLCFLVWGPLQVTVNSSN